MLHCKLRTPWLIHFKLCTFIGIYSLTVCILFGEIYFFIPELWDFIHQIVGATYEKLPTIWWIKSHNSGMKNRNFTKKYTDHRWNSDFSFKSYGKESLYKYCMNVDNGHIMRSWRSCLFKVVILFSLGQS
jgi:hypothetical protein